MAQSINPAVQAILGVRPGDPRGSFDNLQRGIEGFMGRKRADEQQKMIDKLVAATGVAYGATNFDNDEDQVHYLIQQAELLRDDGHDDLAEEALSYINMPMKERNAIIDADLFQASQYLKIPGISAGVNRSASNKYWAPDLVRKPVYDEAGNVVGSKTVRQFPGVDMQSGKPILLEQDVVGDILTNQGETIDERRSGEADLAGDKERNKIDAQISGLPDLEDATRPGVVQTKREIALAESEERANADYRAQVKKDIIGGAATARRSLPNLLRLKRALDQIRTGRLAQARQLLGGLIPGVRDADAEVFNSLAAQYTLDELSRQSGVKTDFDYRKAAETQAQLGNTVEANEAIIDIALNRLDEILAEEAQFDKFTKEGGKAENFRYKPVPPGHLEFFKKNARDPEVRAEFQRLYNYLPSGY